MPRAMNTQAIEKATGKSWDEWLKVFEGMKARDLPHKEIVLKIIDVGGVTPWWAQMITVAYEQHIRRRIPGQRSSGKFQVTASRTVDGTLDAALKGWLRVTAGRREFLKVPIARPATISPKGKYIYWRCGLANGSRLDMSIYERAPGKTVIALGHENLASLKEIDRWRTFWKSQLAEVTVGVTPKEKKPKKPSPRKTRSVNEARPVRSR
jgi:hypothetical protein